MNGKEVNLPLPFVFLSDVHFSRHLTHYELEKREKVFRVFDEVKKSKGTLFLLGDFFDFWWDKGTYIPPTFQEIYDKLKELRDAGVQIHFIGGNHDFWVYTFFCPSLGIVFYDNHMDFIQEGKRFYLAHGDGLLKEDIGYRWLKRILRFPLAIWTFNQLPIEKIYEKAEKMLHNSQEYTSSKWPDLKVLADEMIDYLQDKNRQGYDIAIMGHIHYPKRISNGKKEALILGDWIYHNTYALWDGKTFYHLERKKEESQPANFLWEILIES